VNLNHGTSRFSVLRILRLRRLAGWNTGLGAQIISQCDKWGIFTKSDGQFIVEVSSLVPTVHLETCEGTLDFVLFVNIPPCLVGRILHEWVPAERRFLRLLLSDYPIIQIQIPSRDSFRRLTFGGEEIGRPGSGGLDRTWREKGKCLRLRINEEFLCGVVEWFIPSARGLVVVVIGEWIT
jgi:hypothetical protein